LKTVNIGVIGAGGIAKNAHLPAYKNCEQANVVAVADVNEVALEEAKSKFEIPNGFTDYNDLLKMEDIDAVSVCTPNFLHKDVAIAAMRAGKHVLCEKPLAMNAAEGEEIVAASKETGKQCMVGFVSRFGADAQTLKKFIDAGELGDIYYGRAQYLRRRGIPGWGVFGQKDKQGGGGLIDIGVHALDLALWLMGYPKPVSVSGLSVAKFGTREGVVGLMGQWDVKTFTVEDFGAGFIRFENGSVLLLESSFCLNMKPESMRQIELFGDQGGATIEPVTIFSEKHGVLTDLSPVYVPATKGFELEIAAFVEAVANGTPVPIPASNGVVVSKIIDAIYESSDQGKEVVIG
jgi:predicted dehydrogenase